uniref:LITAF domain-containing protein n=1 Tax=Amphiprion ocellaris TaxID=80972 RepID=A0A3Q1CAM8_AMPOC
MSLCIKLQNCRINTGFFFLVTVQPDPFPVLTPPSVPTAVTSNRQNTGVTVHPVTQIGVTAPHRGRRTQTVVTQPRPVPVSVSYLTDSPALVRCPRCHHLVTTKVQYVPGRAAWLHSCVLAFRLVCGFCLIPLMVHGLQDVHHSCPRCETPLHVYMR